MKSKKGILLKKSYLLYNITPERAEKARQREVRQQGARQRHRDGTQEAGRR